MDDRISGYTRGFGNFLSSEALPGALPEHNSPQRCPYGLYAEQLSSTAFTAPRASNRHTWLYRIRPSAMHSAFAKAENSRFSIAADAAVSPNQLRWDPLPIPAAPSDFLDGLTT